MVVEVAAFSIEEHGECCRAANTDVIASAFALLAVLYINLRISGKAVLLNLTRNISRFNLMCDTI